MCEVYVTTETLRRTLEFTNEITPQPATGEKTNYNDIISSVRLLLGAQNCMLI